VKNYNQNRKEHHELIVENYSRKRKNKIWQIMHIDNFFIMSFTGSMIKGPTSNKRAGFTPHHFCTHLMLYVEKQLK
jgi:hypothetical protein